ncbi:insulinase family protein [Pseudomonas sp. A3.4]|nr:pitrilysin family protein [Atopomonas sediminilitoris]MCJ8170583.1 insulinase family protein [Atopomonas sediminilitoris]
MLADNFDQPAAHAKTDSTANTPTLETLKALEQQSPAPRALNIQRWTTDNGLRVLFMPAHELPMFDLRLTFNAGSARDGAQAGLAMLTNVMLNEGTGTLDTTAIAAGFEDLGAQFGNGAYRDMAIASLRSLSNPAQREPALTLFRQVVAQPSFPAAALARMKNQILAGFEYDKQNPSKQSQQAFFKALYGSHPYAHNSDGTPASIQALTAADLRTFHHRAYSAGNAVLTVVGNLSRDEVDAIANQLSQALPQGPALDAIPAPAKPRAGLQHIDFPSQQTHLLLGELGVSRHDADYAAVYLGNQILGGGGFGTRLMEEVREKRGLTYGIYSGFSPMQARGPFMISVQTRAEQSEGTLALIKQLLADYLKTGPSDAELAAAKRELAGSYPLSSASNADILGQLAAIGFYDLPSDHLQRFMDKIQSLSRDEVTAAMARQLSVDDLVIISLGPTVEQQPIPAPGSQTLPAPSSVPEH